MKKAISICSVIGATITAIVCADIGLYLVSIISTAYMAFWLYANTVAKRKPRAATQGSENRSSTKTLNFYDTTSTIRTQTKVWTPAGKAVIPMHYSE